MLLKGVCALKPSVLFSRYPGPGVITKVTVTHTHTPHTHAISLSYTHTHTHTHKLAHKLNFRFGADMNFYHPIDGGSQKERQKERCPGQSESVRAGKRARDIHTACRGQWGEAAIGPVYFLGK